MYLAADNSLYDAALESLRQVVEASGLGDVQIMVQFDGPTADLASRFRCANGGKRQIWQAEAGYTTDRAKRLEDFFDYAVDTFKRETRVLVILWGHGAGVDQAYVYQEADAATPPHEGAPASAGSNGESRTLAPQPAPAFRAAAILNAGDANVNVSNIALGRILKRFQGKLGHKIDVLGLDACLMGMAEICHELRESVSLLVSSDEEIPQTSWPYQAIVGDLETHPGMDRNTLSTLIVSRYIEAYAAGGNSPGGQMGLSLAVCDLGACDDFAIKFKALTAAISAQLGQGTIKARIVRARDFSRTPREAAYVDLALFLSELTESFEETSAIHQAACEALQALRTAPYIVYHRTVREAGATGGLALYFPKSLAPEEVNAPAPERFPVQPAALVSPAAGATKTPPRSDKNPSDGGRTVSFQDGSSLVITSFRVVWCNYIQLAFNETTKWANLVAQFLPEPSPLPCAEQPETQFPKAVNAPQ
jgi:hypothetical protein